MNPRKHNHPPHTYTSAFIQSHKQTYALRPGVTAEDIKIPSLTSPSYVNFKALELGWLFLSWPGSPWPHSMCTAHSFASTNTENCTDYTECNC